MILLLRLFKEIKVIQIKIYLIQNYCYFLFFQLDENQYPTLQSEYKNKYIEWDPEFLTMKNTNTRDYKTKAFPPQGAPYSQTSNYQDEFNHPKDKEIIQMTVFSPTKHKPEVITIEKPLVKKAVPVQPMVGMRDSESEYHNRFHWHPFADNQQTTHAKYDKYKESGVKDALQPSVDDNFIPVESEYNNQYKDIHDYSPSTLIKKESNLPAQFAWAVVDGPLEDKPKPKINPSSGKNTSEHTSKFKWPLGEARQNPIDHTADMNDCKIGKVFALDTDNDDSTKWQSEYEARCAELRKKQKELLDTNFVAGKPSAQRPNIPTLFAWDEPKPLPPTNYKANPVNPDHFNSEYTEHYLKWKSQPTNPFKPPVPEPLNLFANEQNESIPNSEYLDSFNNKDRDPLNIKFKENNDASNPPQFAWSLINDVKPPSPPPKTKKPAGPLEITEYESKFRWPPAVQQEQKKTKGGQQSFDLFQTQPEEENKNQWKTEYDSHNEQTLLEEKTIPPPPAAGLVTVRVEELPSFFAWADQEAQKPVLPPKPPLDPSEIVHSEYEDQFKPHELLVSTSPVPVQKKAAQTSDIFGTQKEKSKSKTPLTEYDSHFVNFTAEPQSNKRFSHSVSSSAPMQFAWKLVNGEPNVPPPPPVRPTAEFNETTEYDSKFQWQDGAPEKPIPSARVDHFTAMVSLQPNDKDLKTSEWQSEYDDKTSQSRKSYQEMVHRGRRPASAPPTRDINRDFNNAPNFFAWEVADGSLKSKKKISVESQTKSNIFPTEATEYSDRFVDWKKEKTSSLRPPDLLEKPQGPFNGVSEYDDNYIPEQTSKPELAKNDIHSAPTLLNTNLDPDVQLATNKAEKQNKSVSSSVQFSTRPYPREVLVTEHNRQFQWPQNKAPPATPSLYSHKSNDILGVKAANTLSKQPITPGKTIETCASVMSKENSVSSLNQSFNRTETHDRFAWPSQVKNSPSKVSVSSSPKGKNPVLQKAASKYNVIKSNKFAGRTSFHSNVYRPTFSRSQQLVPSTKSTIRVKPSDLAEQHPKDTFASTTGTVMTQDSLNIPDSPVGTLRSEKYENNSVSSPVSVTESHEVSSKLDTSRDLPWQASTIPGLREEDSFRSRSAPPRNHLGYNHFDSHFSKARLFRDESASNPILVNRRYPAITDRQTNRWATEASDNFKWKTR